MPHSRSHNHIRLRSRQTSSPTVPHSIHKTTLLTVTPRPKQTLTLLQLTHTLPFSSFVRAQRTWESKSGHQNLSHHTIDFFFFFYKHHKIIRVTWLEVKELFIRNNPWIRYTLNLLTSLWSTGIHKLLVTNLQKIHSIGPKIQIKSLENRSFFENY